MGRIRYQTVAEIASERQVSIYTIKRAFRRLGIAPVAVFGTVPVFDGPAVRRLDVELARLADERANRRAAAAAM